MKKYFLVLSFSLICFLPAGSLYGFSNNDLTSVEAAILAQDFERAKTLAEELIANHPSEPILEKTKYFLGLSLLHLGRHGEARAYFESVISQNPKGDLLEKAKLGLVDSHYLQEQYPQALEIIQKILRDHPRSEHLSIIYLKLARVHLKLAHWQEAKNYLKKIIRRFPDSPEVPLAKQLLEEKQFFAVQIGSFKERQLAEDLMRDLQKKQEYAYIVEAIDSQNQKFYRVRVGELTSLDEAQILREKLINQGYPTQIYP